MSATVTYKGETLTTATNQTRVLETEGTYLEDDITITDVTGAAPSGTKNISITANGTTTEDVTSYATASITTAVPASAVDSGTKSISISSNGTTTHDVVGYASASITASVPNSYSASDEGKVVSSGALVSQTAHADVTPTTSDQTIDTTTNNSIKVKGDADLVAGNIKKDVEIFGVTGSYEGGGGGTSDNDFVKKDGVSSINVDYESGAMRDYLFYGSTSLQTFNAPNFTGQIPANAFRSCTALTSVNFPKAATCGGNAFQGCTALETLVLPAINGSVGTDAFRGCTNMTAFDIYSPTQLGANSFNGNTKMSVLIIRKTGSIVSLGNVSAFSSTPFASSGSGGTIYVPSALINSYKSASNWSTINGYGKTTWTAIEGSYYATHYADGTVIS